MGGRRVQPRRAGGGRRAAGGGAEIIFFMVCERFLDPVTGDVLRKKYIMLTKFYFVRT